MEIVTLTADNFDEEVVQHNRFGAHRLLGFWCGPCRRMLCQTIEEVRSRRLPALRCRSMWIDEHRQPPNLV